MQIVFDSLPETLVPHMRGGEKEVSLRQFSDQKVKVMQGCLIPGASIGLHTHETNSEVFYILTGTGKVLCDGTEEPLAPGVCHYCPKGHAHSIVNTGSDDLTFVAVIPEQ